MAVGHCFKCVAQIVAGNTQLFGLLPIDFIKVERLVLPLGWLLCLAFGLNLVRVEYLIIRIYLNNFVEKARNLIDRACHNRIKSDMRRGFILPGKLLHEIFQRVAVGINFKEFVRVLFCGIDGVKCTVLVHPGNDFEIAVRADRQ